MMTTRNICLRSARELRSYELLMRVKSTISLEPSDVALKDDIWCFSDCQQIPQKAQNQRAVEFVCVSKV